MRQATQSVVAVAVATGTYCLSRALFLLNLQGISKSAIEEWVRQSGLFVGAGAGTECLEDVLSSGLRYLP